MSDQQAVIRKIDLGERLVFGWSYVAKAKDGTQVVDHSGDTVDPADLESAVYTFVEESRESSDMHGETVTGALVESFVSTPDKLEKMGLARDALPQGHWVGFRLDETSIQKVHEGERLMFSIEGEGVRE